MKATIKEKIDASVEGKLRSLYEMQLIDSKTDRLRIIRGELPLEVQDLEDTVAQLETRFENYSKESTDLEQQVAEKTTANTMQLLRKLSFKTLKYNCAKNA